MLEFIKPENRHPLQGQRYLIFFLVGGRDQGLLVYKKPQMATFYSYDSMAKPMHRISKIHNLSVKQPCKHAYCKIQTHKYFRL